MAPLPMLLFLRFSVGILCMNFYMKTVFFLKFFALTLTETLKSVRFMQRNKSVDPARRGNP